MFLEEAALELSGGDGFLLGQQARVLKEVAQHEHDESADRGVAVVTTRVDLLHSAQVLDEALSLHKLEALGAIQVGRLIDQVLMELVNVFFNLVTSGGHESRVIEDSGPGSPRVSTGKVLLEVEPEFEGADGPLGVN